MGSGEVEDESDTQRAWSERCIEREERGRGEERGKQYPRQARGSEGSLPCLIGTSGWEEPHFVGSRQTTTSPRH